MLKWLEQFTNGVNKYLVLIVLLCNVVALLWPVSFSWVQGSWINPLLGVVMFGMGLTIQFSDFGLVLSRPKDVFLGLIGQFTIMSTLAWVLVQVFNLPLELAIGVVLVGTVPGGTASNVMVFLAKGDVPLSVVLTSVSTLLSPLVTPLLVQLFIGQQITVDFLGMFITMMQIVVLPVVGGLLVKRFFNALTEKLLKVLPLVSIVATLIIMSFVVSANAERILTSGLAILVVLALHNFLGYAVGFGLAKLFRLDRKRTITISLEVGMQNSALATGLATIHFAMYPAAAIAGAIKSAYQITTGAFLGSILGRKSTDAPAEESVLAEAK